MKGWCVSVVFFIAVTNVMAQKYSVEQSIVKFHSSAAIEDIEAVNQTATGLLNVSSNEIAFLLPVRNFKFENSLMEEHFNEKYMESEKYPNATFKGKLEGFSSAISAEQSVKAVGVLSMHGVSRQVSMAGTISRLGDKLIIRSGFLIRLDDYKIKIPQLLWQNIAEEVDVSVEFIFKPL
jgi:polyisoprenoid-binding protein YceI